MFAGTLSAKVSIDQNITGLVGNTDINLTCSFLLKKGEQILSVHIYAKNKTEIFYLKPIAIFEPDRGSRLYLGEDLSGRVTLTNITLTSTNATMTFHMLKCTDEKDYICNLYYYDMDYAVADATSEATRISIQGKKNLCAYITYFVMYLEISKLLHNHQVE